MSSISPFYTISVAVPDPKKFVCIPVFCIVTVNPNGIKTHLANGLITFFINGSPVTVFNNGPRSLPRNPSF